MSKKMVTKNINVVFGAGRSKYSMTLPAGLRVKPIIGEPQPSPQKWWLDEFPLDLFPMNSFERHDGMHYGVRLTDNDVEEVVEE